MMAVVSSDEKERFHCFAREFEAFGKTLNIKINIQSGSNFWLRTQQRWKMDIKQVTETIKAIEEQNFGYSTTTMGISYSTVADDVERAAEIIRRLLVKLEIW